MDAFGGGGDSALTIVRDGESYVFTGALDFSPGHTPAPGEDTDTSNISVTLTFPGAVVSSNGDASDRTVRWETSYEEDIRLEARASAVAEPEAWPWVPGGIVLRLILVGVTVASLVRRRAAR